MKARFISYKYGLKKAFHNVNELSTSSINGKIDLSLHLQGLMIMIMINLIILKHVILMFT
jgi:hypothetical protein